MMPVMKILYGPPGTGKTWRAAREAIRAIDPVEYEKILGETDSDKKLSALHDTMVKNGKIAWVTFHPSYSYEDFMEGYRPVASEGGHLSYQVFDGPFKKLCNLARGNVDLQLGDILTKADDKPYGEVVDKDQGGWVVRVTPQRSDQVAPEMFKYVDRFTIKKVIEQGLPPTIFSIAGTGNFDIRTYGLNPESDDIPPPNESEGESFTHRGGSNIRRFVGAKVGISSSDLSNSAHYGAVMRRLIELESAKPSTRVALVIDEINRADLSRVFGELLTLLETDKREGMSEQRRVILPYSKELFSVPLHVSVIGTMNTVDRSLSALDFAMRRRFEFCLVDVDPSLCPNSYGGINLQAVLRTINRGLDALLGKEYRVGHSTFMETALDSIKAMYDWSGEDAELRSIAHTFRTRLLPLLSEYFHDDWRKAEAVAGRSEFEGVSFSLFMKISPDEALIRQLPEEYDLEESTSYDFAAWWNPLGEDWHPENYKKFLMGLAARS